MKNLDFSFPIIRNEEKTRENHMGKCEKIKDVEINLPSPFNTARDTLDDNQMEFEYNPPKKGQSGVKVIKTRVNATMYNWLKYEITRQGFPESYTTALYLNNFDEINEIMEDASKEVYKALNG